MRVWFWVAMFMCIRAGVAGADAAAPSQVAAPAGDACANAGTATNAVIRFYLAVDTHQFAAAYRCLAAVEQQALPYPTFVAGYNQTMASHLLVADSEVPNGTPVHRVNVTLQAVDRATLHRTLPTVAHPTATPQKPPALIATTYTGGWSVNGAGRLTRALVSAVRSRSVTAVPPLDVTAIFSATQRIVLVHLRADVTGDRRPDDLYITSGAGCGSCHAQQVWIFSDDRLIFQQQADDAEIRIGHDNRSLDLRTDTPGTPGLDSCCPSARTDSTWHWTPTGFALDSQRIVHTHLSH